MHDATTLDDALARCPWAVQWHEGRGRVERFRYPSRTAAQVDLPGYGPDAYIARLNEQGQWVRAYGVKGFSW